MKHILFILLSLVLTLNNSFAMESTKDSIIEESYSQTQNLPKYAYPYYNLIDDLNAQGKTHILLFSYGSLMDIKSASKTLSPQALATRRPALAFGLQRTFDRNVPITEGSPLGIPCDSKATGMLNVHPTNNLNHVVNGVNIEIPLADIAALMAREIGYDLIPVVTADWDELQKDNLKISIAYTLSAQLDSIYVSSTILPRPGYYELTRNAAKQYGSQFESIWYSSTYMGDSVTPIDIWEKLVESGNNQTLVCTP